MRGSHRTQFRSVLRFSLWLLLFVLFVLASGPATAEEPGPTAFAQPETWGAGESTWYVATQGDDTNGDGSLSSPFRTIQRAIDTARDGDTVVVLEGRYTGPGNTNLDFLGKAIIVQSRDPDDEACRARHAVGRRRPRHTRTFRPRRRPRQLFWPASPCWPATLRCRCAGCRASSSSPRAPGRRPAGWRLPEMVGPKPSGRLVRPSSSCPLANACGMATILFTSLSPQPTTMAAATPTGMEA